MGERKNYNRGFTYSMDKQARCLAKLYVSASLVDGEPLPNFLAVAKQEDVNSVTLKRWWDARDKAKDSEWIKEATRKAANAFVGGAEAWGDHFARLLRQRAMELVEDSERWKEAKVDEVARAIRAFNQYQKEMAIEAGADRSPEAVQVRVQAALARRAKGDAHRGPRGG